MPRILHFTPLTLRFIASHSREQHVAGKVQGLLPHFKELTMSRNQTFTNDLDRMAHQRASRKMGWYIHAFVYIVVNLGLMALSAMSGKHWAIFPAFGWGLGVAIHGLVVFAFLPGNGLHERLVQREREQLATQVPAQRDPW